MPPEVLLRRAQQRQRLRIALAVVPLVIAAAVWSYGFLYVPTKFESPSFEEYQHRLFVSRLFQLIPLGFLFVSGFGILMIYLQTGFKKTSISDVISERYIATLNPIKPPTIALDEIDRLKTELLDLKNRLDRPRTDQVLTDAQRLQLAETIRQKLLSEHAQKLVAEFRGRLEAAISQDERRKTVTAIFGGTLQRLNLEVGALGRRGNTNLSIGIVMTLAGLAVLGELVFRGTLNPKDALDLSAHYIPRLTLVIFIEIFAYFFLKLYKSSLSEIKYFQNEMTNVEAKQAALTISLDEDDKTVRSDIVKMLANTERNSVLKKGETTVELERVKLDKDTISEIIPKLLAPFTKQSK